VTFLLWNIKLQIWDSSTELSSLHDHRSYVGLNHTTLHVLCQTCRWNYHRFNILGETVWEKKPRRFENCFCLHHPEDVFHAQSTNFNTVSRSDSVVNEAVLRSTGSQPNRDSPAGKGTIFLSSPEPPDKVVSPQPQSWWLPRGNETGAWIWIFTSIYREFGKSLCTCKRCWKWCPRASIQAWTLFNCIRKHFLQICLWGVSYVRSYCSF
jgi:hypothetical protein